MYVFQQRQEIGIHISNTPVNNLRLACIVTQIVTHIETHFIHLGYQARRIPSSTCPPNSSIFAISLRLSSNCSLM